MSASSNSERSTTLNGCGRDADGRRRGDGFR
jgi:hypothetical protein